ncbi:beta-lactamase family protein [Streptomyces sp. MBT56]|uniref:serine hydrolase domain-containing protein n=1 Tax=unclassified Streptomyces TaxID=2593676 RepID=UPI00190B490F|nr:MULTISPECIES: serine hydrolase domain-containing protein [unclassified Streptomyces]MBK3533628.1 beta-lactamase family protein [Streptomyces sp. MBT72]MBK3538097.1 beta-lactamase family protein [Streptomyces sp. MBT67]MBK3552251.1 beta-lactamase family protein [Streptomyces sp. MBT61]MBK3560307.1 beta-lactamase family protein [Streptomyces sp. MBT56]MBK3599973.1 beta-lactamase family protein [Streptomyces sp. MBT54]
MIDRIEALLDEGVRDKVYPGAVWAVGDTSGVRVSGTTGVLDPDEPEQRMRPDTVFDAASLTKILAVWSSIGAFWEDSVLDLDQPLGGFWPEAEGRPLGQVTARQLLTHAAGVPLRAQLKNLYGTDREAIRRGVLHEELHRPPGEAVEYTDRAALILGYLAEHLSGQSLDQVAAARTWRPLGMDSTRFGPLPDEIAARCAPTELDQDTDTHLKGVAHDFSARLLGGVCGIAGVFTALDDLIRFLRYMLEPATAPAEAGFGAEWTAYSLTVQTGSLEPARGLFWHPAPGTTDEDDVWVHYGFTGTGMWLSPATGRWAVLLTNKLYYTRDRQPLTDVRNTFRQLAFS